MTDGRQQPRILVIAYLCEPRRGSERGAGWGMVRALQRFADCTVVTGPESGRVLDRWLNDNPEEPVEFVTVTEPRWSSVLKRHRIGEFLVYLAWQRRVAKDTQISRSGDTFDAVIHATLSAFWLPSVAVKLGLPSIWGPVGGAVTTPVKLWPLLGWKGVAVEIIDWLAVRAMSFLPGTRRTWQRSTVRIIQNEETLRRLPRALRGDATVLNHAVFHEISTDTPRDTSDHHGGYIAWVSPMESRKGPELAVRALAATAPGVMMIMAGDGPERARIEEIARELEVDDRITFTGMVPHQRALDIIRNADVALFTGLREEGGLALSEAMLLGTPVVVLANGGAATIARTSIDHDRVSLIEPVDVARTTVAMARSLEHHMERERNGEVRTRYPLLDRDAALEELSRLISSAVTRGTGTGT